MHRQFTSAALLLAALVTTAQTMWAQVPPPSDSTNEPLNTANRIINNNQDGVTVGSYAQIDYNQPFGDTVRRNGKLDVHRLIIFLGYKFNDRTHFVTEVEIEHVKEVYVEQAFLNYKMNDRMNFRAGLLLIPMGIINEYHEPPTYNGVERPAVDGNLVPTTWREIGAGFAGRFDNASLRYQLYAVNGFNGYNGGGVLRGSDGLRKGRQKGAESFMSSPNLSGKLDYYGIGGLKVGLAGYFGKTQSTLYDGLDESDDALAKNADSSVVGISMASLDARYERGAFEARAQFIYAALSNTAKYNAFTGKDLGAAMSGYYAEAGYDVLHGSENTSNELVLFVRYESYDTHTRVAGNLARNDAFNRNAFHAGLGFKVHQGAVFKADYQLSGNQKDTHKTNTLNLGVGVWF